MRNFLYKNKKLIAYIITIFIAVYFLNRLFRSYFKEYYNPERIKNWILSFGKTGFLVFILLHVMQVVFFFIPGEVIQTAGGYIYGTAMGTVYSLFGIMIGSIGVFLFVRVQGERILRRVFPQEDFDNIKNLINKPKSKAVLFLLFLIPGMPKDILCFVSGITTLKLCDFLLISSVGRIPGIIMSTYIGANLYKRNYLVIIITAILIMMVLGLAARYRERILIYLKE